MGLFLKKVATEVILLEGLFFEKIFATLLSKERFIRGRGLFTKLQYIYLFGYFWQTFHRPTVLLANQ